MAISSRSGADIFLGIPLLAVSNLRPHWPCGDSSHRRVPAGGSKFPGPRALLVCADPVVVERQFAHVERIVLDGPDRLGTRDLQHLAPWHARRVLCVFPFVRERGIGILRLSIGWHAAGGGIYFVVPRSTGMAPGTRPRAYAYSRQRVPFALGMVPDLL